MNHEEGDSDASKDELKADNRNRQIGLMLVPVLLWAKMSFRIHGLTALWTDRPAAGDHIRTPPCQLADLFRAAPETDSRGMFLIGLLGLQLFNEDHNQVT